MKITAWFTRPQVLLGVYDFLLSDEYNWSYLKRRQSYIKKALEWQWMGVDIQ